MDIIPVTADDRERGAGVIDALRTTEEASVRIGHLELGDYRVGEELLFERKTLPDLAVSIVQGRLFSQMTRLAASPHRGVLLLEGTGRDLRKVSVNREAIQGALITTTLLLDIPILRSRDSEETARLILYAARQIKRRVAGGIYRHGYRPKGRHRRQLYVLQGLPGVGVERAEKLLEAFGNVEGVMAAGEEDLYEVPGIGPKTAESIRSVLREQTPPYQLGD